MPNLTGVGQPNGLATTDNNNTLTQSQIPSNVPKLDATTKQEFHGPIKIDGDTDFPNWNATASGVDSFGHYTVTTYTRPGGNKAMVSTLSGTADSFGNYPTMTNVFYQTDGVTVDHTDTWTLTFDANGIKTGQSVVRS